MKKILLLTLIFNLIIGCQSAQNAFTLKKKDNADEFLVEKKNPLVLPPDFSKLPTPGLENDNILNNEIDEKNFESILKSKPENTDDLDSPKNSSIEEFILENINKNEFN